MKKEQETNANPVIWITKDIEEWDSQSIDMMTYKGNEEKCYERDVDVFDPEVKLFNVGDYILEASNMIQINSAKLWKITYIFDPDEYHDGEKCRRMLISENWKTLKLESLSLFAVKNNIDFKYILR